MTHELQSSSFLTDTKPVKFQLPKHLVGEDQQHNNKTNHLGHQQEKNGEIIRIFCYVSKLNKHSS